MIRRIPGLSAVGPSQPELPDGEYLVRVAHAHYRFDRNKPYYSFQFEVLEPVSVERSPAASTAMPRPCGS